MRWSAYISDLHADLYMLTSSVIHRVSHEKGILQHNFNTRTATNELSVIFIESFHFLSYIIMILRSHIGIRELLLPISSKQTIDGLYM